MDGKWFCNEVLTQDQLRANLSNWVVGGLMCDEKYQLVNNNRLVSAVARDTVKMVLDSMDNIIKAGKLTND